MSTINVLDPQDSYRVLPGMTDDTGWTAEVVASIAYWQDTVSTAGHALAHPNPVWGCPGCPQGGTCPYCLRPSVGCPDPSVHRRADAASEPRLLAS